MTEDEKAAFALGAQMGEQAESITKQLRFSAVELAAFRKGLSTTMAGEKSPYVYEQYVGLLKARAEAGRAQETAATKAKGDAFREAASGESGATRTATGLVFRTLQPGQGESPKASDVVRVNYRGTLIDGTEFDASRGEASFGLDGVIPCWTEGVQLMRVGEKARLVCPPEIAYGDRAPGPIPAGSTLVFEVELVGIGAPAAEPTAAPEPKPATPTPEPPAPEPKSATPTPEPASRSRPRPRRDRPRRSRNRPHPRRSRPRSRLFASGRAGAKNTRQRRPPMFETAEIGRTVSREEYEAEESKLRLDLLEAQRALQKAGVPVVLLLAGADGAGKGETVKKLLEWLDARGLDTHAFGPPTDEERERPRWWRYWMSLPPRGRIGIFFGSWYSDPLVDRAFGRLGRGRFDRMLSEIAFFEQMLAEDGALIVKLWIHLSKKGLRRRLQRLEQDPATRWKVTPSDWKHFKKYDSYIEASEEVIRRTDTGLAPWLLVEAADDRYRDLTAGRILLERFRDRLAAVQQPAAPAPAVAERLAEAAPAPALASTSRRPKPVAKAHERSLTILDRVDLTKTVDTADYERRLDRAQGRLGRLVREAFAKGRSSVVVFEGWDASGKGGNIRRLTAAMDPRTYRVISVAAPTDEEKAHHYLWRFWRQVPRAGYVTVYDRSWYGRVLVERVEGFARSDEWNRAYLEINDFEQQLVAHGVVLAKFWLHVDQKEQLRRFHERETVAWKAHKIGPEDWRNREKWAAYEDAVVDMVARTSTREAPWTLVGANDKRSARIQVVETLCERLGAALQG